jgi:membrane protein
VRIAHAALGALIAALLFGGLRWGYQLYLHEFPAYATLYGALSVVPIFLLWVYLVWCVVLFGAEFAASMPEWRRRPGAGTTGASLPTRRLAAALLMLSRLYSARSSGDAVQTDGLADVAAEALADSDRGAVQAILDRLAADKVIGRAEGGGWYLVRDPAEIKLADLLHGLDLGFEAAGQLDFLRAPWRERAVAVMAGAAQAERAALDFDLATLFGSEPRMPAHPAGVEPLKRKRASRPPAA